MGEGIRALRVFLSSQNHILQLVIIFNLSFLCPGMARLSLKGGLLSISLRIYQSEYKRQYRFQDRRDVQVAMSKKVRQNIRKNNPGV